uniref:ATP synthase F0 subunit 8 n=1 Tax=Panagrolaimus davidi TaxID=227884 RepID=A0A914P8D9_9BILA
MSFLLFDMYDLIVVAIIGAVGIYFFFFKSAASSTVESSSNVVSIATTTTGPRTEKSFYLRMKNENRQDRDDDPSRQSPAFCFV